MAKATAPVVHSFRQMSYSGPPLDLIAAGKRNWLLPTLRDLAHEISPQPSGGSAPIPTFLVLVDQDHYCQGDDNHANKRQKLVRAHAGLVGSAAREVQTVRV